MDEESWVEESNLKHRFVILNKYSEMKRDISSIRELYQFFFLFKKKKIYKRIFESSKRSKKKISLVLEVATISIRGFINTFLLRVTVDRKTTFDVVRGLQR